MNSVTTGHHKGILNPAAVETKFQLARHEPAPPLQSFIARYWIIRWDLRVQGPHVQETLPYPCVNLVFEQNNSRLYGVISRKFRRRLEGKGQVFGIKFRPGALYPILKRPVSSLTDCSLAAVDVFGVECEGIEEEVLGLEDDTAMVRRVECFLTTWLPEPDTSVALVNRIIDSIIGDRTIMRVSDLVHRFDLSDRSLQRLFSQYVGVSPKWVIQRFRLQEAAEQLAKDDVGDCAQLALELGYFDQAHFIKDFKAVIGATPGEYARNLSRPL